MGRSRYGAVLLYFLVFSPWVHVQSEEGSHLSAELTDKGLNFFVHTLLMEQAVTSLLPFHLPTLENYVKIPLIGSVHVKASNMSLYSFHVASSAAKIGDTGLVIDLSGAFANLSFNWEYSYTSHLFPISISDKGDAAVQVAGMEIGLTINLKNDQGSLQLSVMECGCHVEDISITVEGGASWLYQGLIDAFEGLLPPTVENTISEKIKEGTESFNAIMQSFTKEFPVGSFGALNITLVGEPELSDSSLKLAVNGLFTAKDGILVSKSHNEYLQDPLSFESSTRMIKMSVHERVLESATLIFFETDKLHWIVDTAPDESLLNTAGWKYVIPQLYKQYPDDQLNLNVSARSPPIIKIEESQVAVTAPLEVIINVLDSGEIIPVVCILVEFRATVAPKISSNTVSGTIKLEEFNMSLEWSKIGKLHMTLVETLVSTLLRSVVLPLVNVKLSRGLALPVFHGYGVQNTNIEYSNSWVAVSTDIAPIEMLQSLLSPSFR